MFLVPCSLYGLFCISYFIVDPLQIWKVLTCFEACHDWFTILFFKKKKGIFFPLNRSLFFFYEQFTKFTALFSLTWFTIIHLFLKVFKIKFLLGIFYSPVLPVFFWCNMQIRYYSFSTFAQKWNNAYHKFDFKKFHSASS